MKHTVGGIIQRLRDVISVRDAAAHSDCDLVQRFASKCDSAAFEAIVRRHGPMVLGVCRRLLHDCADADDAFQATFAILVRKAGSLTRPEQLAGWLFQVAYRTARRARSDRLRRQSNQIPLSDIAVSAPIAEIVWRELQPIFDEEVNRLPDKLRLPVVMCFLEGRTKRSAARSLGWAEGTFSCRLQQARELLRSRLTRRGVSLSAGAMTFALFQGTASAAVSPSLMTSTVHNASLAAAGSALTAPVAALTQGVIQSMFLTKLKVVAALVVAFGVLGGGTGWFMNHGTGQGNVAIAGEPGATPSEKKAPPTNPDKTPRNLEKASVDPFGQLVGAEDKPEVAEARRQRDENALLQQKIAELTKQIKELQLEAQQHRAIAEKQRDEAEQARMQAMKALVDLKSQQAKGKGEGLNAPLLKAMNARLEEKIAVLTSEAKNLHVHTADLVQQLSIVQQALAEIEAGQAKAKTPPLDPTKAVKEGILSRPLRFVSVHDMVKLLKKAFATETNTTVQMTYDERLNTIYISSSPEVLAKARKLLDEFDRPGPSKTPVILGDSPLMMTYTTQPGAAPIVVKKLSEIFPPNANLKIWDVGPSQIMAWAGPDDQSKIAKFLAGQSPKVDVAVEEADVRKSEAELHALETKLKLRADYFSKLKKNEGAVPQQTIDTAKAAILEADGEVQVGQANLERAKALLERARAAKQPPPVDPRIANAELSQLEDRLAWATRMHSKGYLSKAQVDEAAAQLEKARAVHALAKLQETPASTGGVDPRLTNLEDRLEKLRRLHAQGAVSAVEVDRARLAVAEARIAAELRTIRELYKKNPNLK